ncbi:MAG: hypothetical protein ABI477_03650 [Chryseolinea sp.]
MAEASKSPNAQNKFLHGGVCAYLLRDSCMAKITARHKDYKALRMTEKG